MIHRQAPNSQPFDTPQAPALNASAAERVYSSAALLQGTPSVWIEHAGERYLLRQTKQGKLILTK